jgi:hypothetical protein
MTIKRKYPANLSRICRRLSLKWSYIAMNEDMSWYVFAGRPVGIAGVWRHWNPSRKLCCKITPTAKWRKSCYNIREIING